MSKTKLYPILSLLVALSVLATGCAAPKPAALTDAQVVEVTENILLALDTGDYVAFTRDLSADMLTAFTEDQFTQLRGLIQNASGAYSSIGELDLSNSQGFAVYRFICLYENEDVVVTVIFKVGGGQVEGLYFDSPNLRSAGQ